MKINGTSLGDSSNRIVATAYSYDQNVRQGTVSLHGGGEYAEALGVDYPRMDITFTIIGADDTRFDWVSVIRGLTSSTDKWELEAEASDGNLRIFDGFEAAVMGTEGAVKVQIVDRAKVTVTVPAILFGAPAWVGGSYVDEQNLVAEFLSNDFYTTTGDPAYDNAALIGCRPQVSGYPKAMNTTTGVKEALPLFGTLTGSNGDGTTSTVELYDLAGYIFGEPQSQGDSGPAVVCFSAAGAP